MTARWLDLNESREKERQSTRFDPDSCVAHGNPHVPACLFHLDVDFTVVGELHGIGCKVRHDLPDSWSIAIKPAWHVRTIRQMDERRLSTGLWQKKIYDLGQFTFQVEWRCGGRHLAGFDLGKIQNVIQDSHHTMCRPADGFQVA